MSPKPSFDDIAARPIAAAEAREAARAVHEKYRSKNALAQAAEPQEEQAPPDLQTAEPQRPVPTTEVLPLPAAEPVRQPRARKAVSPRPKRKKPEKTRPGTRGNPRELNDGRIIRQVGLHLETKVIQGMKLYLIQEPTLDQSRLMNMVMTEFLSRKGCIKNAG